MDLYADHAHTFALKAVVLVIENDAEEDKLTDILELVGTLIEDTSPHDIGHAIKERIGTYATGKVARELVDSLTAAIYPRALGEYFIERYNDQA